MTTTTTVPWKGNSGIPPVEVGELDGVCEVEVELLAKTITVPCIHEWKEQ